MTNKFRPKRTLKTAISFLVLIALFLTSLPLLTKVVLIYGLHQAGASHSNIDDIDINLFTGHFSITGLQTQTENQPPLYIGQLSILFPYWELFNHHIMVKEVTLSNSHFPLIKNGDNNFYSGIFFKDKHSKTPETEKDKLDDKEQKPWFLSINKLLIHDSNIQLKLPQISSDIDIETLNLTHFSSQSSEKSQLSLNAHIDNTHVNLSDNDFKIQVQKPIKWHSKQSFQFSNKDLPSFFMKGNLALEDLSIYNPRLKTTYKHDHLSLLLSGDINSRPKPQNEPTTSVSIKTELSIKKPSIAGQLSNNPDSEEFMAQAAIFDMQFIQRFVLSDTAKPIQSSGTGRLNLQGAKLKLQNNALSYSHENLMAQWLIATENSKKQPWQDTLKLEGSIDLTQAKILDSRQNLGLLDLPQLAIHQIKLTGTDKLQIDTIQLDQMRTLYALPGASPAHKPFISNHSLHIEDLQLHPFNYLHIKHIKSTGLSSQLQVTEHKKLRLLKPTLTRLKSISLGLTEKNIETMKNAAPTPPDSFTWRIEDLSLSNGEISISDSRVSPSFTSQVTLEKLTLSPIDSSNKELPSHLSFKGEINSHSRIEAEGAFTVFKPKASSNIALSVQALELLPFSPYLNQSTGYRIKHGQLNSKIQFIAQDGILDSSAELNLKKLKLEPASESAKKRLSKQLTMPLDVTLNTLRDKNNNIQLSIPVQGDISDPKFDFSDAIKQASAKATRAASMSLLKHALQPYGTMITVAELAYKGGKKLTKIRLSPINYPRASVNLPEEQKDYLRKVATLMEDRPKIEMTVCGIALANELPSSQSEEALLKLASMRGEQVKGLLVNEYRIDAARLFLCVPKIDNAVEKKRTGRVELDL